MKLPQSTISLIILFFSAQLAGAERNAANALLSDAQAKIIITQYYNQHSMWTNAYSLQAIKRIKLERFNDRRVVAHVEYSYQTKSEKARAVNGIDKRTFLLILRNRWEVISMGPHLSGRL